MFAEMEKTYWLLGIWSVMALIMIHRTTFQCIWTKLIINCMMQQQIFYPFEISMIERCLCMLIKTFYFNTKV